jgi:tetratricopeptide (TPR) repeat protein
LDDLLRMVDYYFPADASQRAPRLAEASASLAARASAASAAAASSGAPAATRAAFLLLHGRALDAGGGEYSPEAEALISRAVRLDSSQAQAWAALGHVQFKKNDLESARESYAASLERAPSADSHRALSHLARIRPPPGSDTASIAVANAAAAAETIRHAKAAVQLDIAGAKSWVSLGLAHFFEAGNVSFSAADVRRGRAAFSRAAALEARAAEVDDTPERDPDLHFNRGHLCAYAEDYAGAIASFKVADEIDPSLSAHVRDERESRVACHRAVVALSPVY